MAEGDPGPQQILVTLDPTALKGGTLWGMEVGEYRTGGGVLGDRLRTAP